jgi:hypothetical protein
MKKQIVKKQIALGIAAALIGVSGVAGAMVSVDQLTSAASSESSISAVTDQLVANCWMVTGSSNDAGCNTSVAGLEVPGLPELPDRVAGVDIPDATGLLAMASNAVGTATGAVGSAQGIVGGALPTAEGLAGTVAPSACKLPVALPVKLPVPASIFNAGLSLFGIAQHLAMSDLGLAGVSSPVPLPVALPADDLINTIEDEAACLSHHAGGLPAQIPAVCTADVGVPSAVTSAIPSAVTDAIPGAISGLLSSTIQDLTSITGQGINVADEGTLGVNCNADGAVNGATGALPGLPGLPALPGLPSLPGLGSLPALPLPTQVVPSAPIPALPIPAVPAIPDVVGTATGTVAPLLDTVTGTVDGLLSGGLPALPLPTNCSASASGSVGGLLGSLTSTITGGCN